MRRIAEEAASRLARAISDWRRLLGAKRVLSDHETLARYRRTNLGRAPVPVAVVRPERAAQIPEVLRLARDERVALYPISRGRNWGWGEACPATPGQAILDLSGLDRILEINASSASPSSSRVLRRASLRRRSRSGRPNGGSNRPMRDRKRASWGTRSSAALA